MPWFPLKNGFPGLFPSLGLAGSCLGWREGRPSHFLLLRPEVPLGVGLGHALGEAYTSVLTVKWAEDGNFGVSIRTDTPSSQWWEEF